MFKRLEELPLCMRLIKETHSILLSGVRGNENHPESLGNLKIGLDMQDAN